MEVIQGKKESIMTETKIDLRFNKTAPTFGVTCYAMGDAPYGHMEIIISSDKEKLTLLIEFDDYEKLKQILGVNYHDNDLQ
jgi:hypothetical protein